MSSASRIAFSALLLVMAGHTSARNLIEENGCYSTIPFTPAAVDFDFDIQPLFDQHCVSCHQPGAERFAETELDLRPGRSYRSLVGVPSALKPDALRVTPFSPDVPDASFLWEKIGCSRPAVGERMPPPPYGALSQQDQLKIDSWILRGAAPGMAGSGRSIPIQYGMTGSWYDPSALGQGFMFEVVGREPALFVVGWMTHARAFVPSGGATGVQRLRWMLGTGTYVSDAREVQLEVRLFTGASFDNAYDGAMPQVIGTARLLFHSCTEATLLYDLKFDGDEAQRVKRGIALRRLTPNVLCKESAAAR